MTATATSTAQLASKKTLSVATLRETKPLLLTFGHRRFSFLQSVNGTPSMQTRSAPTNCTITVTHCNTLCTVEPSGVSSRIEFASNWKCVSFLQRVVFVCFVSIYAQISTVIHYYIVCIYICLNSKWNLLFDAFVALTKISRPRVATRRRVLFLLLIPQIKQN